LEVWGRETMTKVKRMKRKMAIAISARQAETETKSDVMRYGMIHRRGKRKKADRKFKAFEIERRDGGN
jgi:hypothetical protein